MHKIFLFLLLFFIFIFNVSLVSCQSYIILNEEELRKVPSVSKDNYCDYDLQILIEDFSTYQYLRMSSNNYSDIANVYPSSFNQTHTLFNPIFQIVTEKEITINLNVAREDSNMFDFTIKLVCKDINFNQLEISLLQDFKPLYQYFESLWQINGIDYPTLNEITYSEDQLTHNTALRKVDDSIFSLVLTKPPLDYDASTNKWNVYLSFFNSSGNSMGYLLLKVNNPFKDYNDNFVSSVTQYPNFSPSNNIGFFSTPIIGFKYTNPNKVLNPYFTVYEKSYGYYFDSPLPVSGRVGDINYLCDTFMGMDDLVLNVIEISVNKNGQRTGLQPNTIFSYQGNS
ncbi:hypothetical protein DICPUDRAFT_80641 [Dictyostelium purpureum]|uniref:Uncharacterized protein n=1 Tax=Dictyostelium purpureum TaxID=5786 RepID=F0ZR35_DICPU|nr:uncharacterized protein DICPUDRAFT_80641 [Dictyostelium purpureum]EGC33604.1 hypothetical protein DICPUDRAFT_80641 [Dictyostelium purpureum]|eukprot:XP_003289872.1 hypothetical protein DICPUDRAFT_80641 [Dictyostelium purpureum]